MSTSQQQGPTLASLPDEILLQIFPLIEYTTTSLTDLRLVNHQFNDLLDVEKIVINKRIVQIQFSWISKFLAPLKDSSIGCASMTCPQARSHDLTNPKTFLKLDLLVERLLQALADNNQIWLTSWVCSEYYQPLLRTGLYMFENLHTLQLDTEILETAAADNSIGKLGIFLANTALSTQIILKFASYEFGKAAISCMMLEDVGLQAGPFSAWTCGRAAAGIGYIVNWAGVQGIECLLHHFTGRKVASYYRLACNLFETDLVMYSGRAEVMREYAKINRLTVAHGCTSRLEFITRLTKPYNEARTAVIIYDLTMLLLEGDIAELRYFMEMFGGHAGKSFMAAWTLHKGEWRRYDWLKETWKLAWEGIINAELVCMAVHKNSWFAALTMKTTQEEILQQFCAYERSVQIE